MKEVVCENIEQSSWKEIFQEFYCHMHSELQHNETRILFILTKQTRLRKICIINAYCWVYKECCRLCLKDCSAVLPRLVGDERRL